MSLISLLREKCFKSVCKAGYEDWRKLKCLLQYISKQVTIFKI